MRKTESLTRPNKHPKRPSANDIKPLVSDRNVTELQKVRNASGVGINALADRFYVLIKPALKVIFYPLVVCALIAFSFNGVVHGAAGTSDDYRLANQAYIYVHDAGSNLCHGYAANITGDYYSNYIHNASNWVNTTNQAAFDTSFQTALSDGSWSVSQQVESNGDKLIDIAWYEDNTASVDWDGTGNVVYNAPSGHGLHSVRIWSAGVSTGSGPCDAKVVSNDTVSSTHVSSQDPDIGYPDRLNLLVGGQLSINYPSDYVGLPINSRAHLATEIYPEINFSVDNYELKASYAYNIDYHNPSTVALDWTLYKIDGGGALLEQARATTGESDTVDFKLSDQGNYALTLRYRIIPPATYDPNNLDTIGVTSVGFNYDGTAINQNSADMECTDGVCTAVSPYEDCTTYGVDIIGGFGCIIRNFGVAIQAFLKFLFIPNASKLKVNFDSLASQAEQKLGFLLYPIEFVVSFFTAFGDTSNNWCTDSSCEKDFGTLFGKHYVINFTQLHDTIPTMYDFMLLAIRALTIFAVLYMLRRKYMEVMTK